MVVVRYLFLCVSILFSFFRHVCLPLFMCVLAAVSCLCLPSVLVFVSFVRSLFRSLYLSYRR